MQFEQRQERNSIFFITASVGAGLFLLIVLRLLFVQIVCGSYYAGLAENIRARVIPEIAPRGVIFDRYGKILAESKIIYAVDILPSQVKNPERVFRFLREIGIDTSKIEEKMAKKNFLPYEPIRIKGDITREQIGFIEENKALLDGVIISSRILRSYPNNAIAAHILGYVGEIDSKELKRLKKFGYQIGDIVGLAGLERYYDKFLKGVNGGQPLEVDPLGNPVRKLDTFEPIPGSDVHTTIDLDLQKAAEAAFGDRKGAVVIIDPRTGEVLTMFSKPDYNPNFFTDFLTDEEWKSIRSKEQPLHNRALSGYPPGSTFKIITSMTALEDQNFNLHQHFFCPGYFRLSGRTFRCWRKEGHGAIDFYHGFLESCNVVFYTIGLQLDPDRIAKVASSFGLGLATGIDYPYEATGLIPTQRWKVRTYNQPWYPGDSLNMAIGQGYILATPLQMSLVAASLANPEHHLMKPYLVTHIVDTTGKEVLTQRPEIAGTLPFAADHVATIVKLMTEVVSKGTGRNAYLPEFPVAGKTGTSEVFNQKKDHAWFISFGPVAQPEIAMAVFVEEGGFGGVTAAGISREIYAWWAKNRGMKKS